MQGSPKRDGAERDSAPDTECGPCVVVGFDGSDAARRAVRGMCDRVAPKGTVIVVCACPCSGIGLCPCRGPDRRLSRARREAVLESALLDAEIPELVSVVLEVRDRPAPQAILEAAREHAADTIAVATRGIDRAPRGIGRVARALAELTDRPLVLWPA